MTHILITNDDGYLGRGLFPLIESLIPLGRVSVVVPDKNCSATSHAITLDRPITVRRITRAAAPIERYILRQLEGRMYRISGTPADCVRLGMIALLQEPVDLVVAGINEGANLGTDTIYSGTVAAAREAAIEGSTGVAISQVPDAHDIDFEHAALVARVFCQRLIAARLPTGIYWNVNIPPRLDITRARFVFAQCARREYGRRFSVARHNHHTSRFILHGAVHDVARSIRTDAGAIARCHIPVTSFISTHVSH